MEKRRGRIEANVSSRVSITLERWHGGRPVCDRAPDRYLDKGGTCRNAGPGPSKIRPAIRLTSEPTPQPVGEDTMKYVCLIYQDENARHDRSQAELDKILAEYKAFQEDIVKSGHYLVSNGLQPTRTATTVRVRNGKLSTTDGPFMETKEQIGRASCRERV